MRVHVCPLCIHAIQFKANDTGFYFALCDRCIRIVSEEYPRAYMKTEKVSLPEELYKSWLEDETNKVDKMSVEELQAHIMELEKTIFETKTRLSISHTKRVKLQGADWAANSRAISSPDFKVNMDADPRKKREPKQKQSKEEKNKTMLESAGIDPEILKAMIKKKMLERATKK